MDAPEPEWKYLSGFAVKKGLPGPAGRGITDRLLDEDNREDVPTAESQYAIQKAIENPMAFAATDNLDI